MNYPRKIPVKRKNYPRKIPVKPRKYDKKLYKLSIMEQRVYDLLVNANLTAKQIQIKLKLSPSTYYFHRKNIKNKGFLRLNFTLENNGSTFPVNSSKNNSENIHQIRLHGLELNINILYKDSRYKDTLKRSNILDIDGNTIRLYRDSIEAYINTSFFGETAQKATAKSVAYTQKLLNRLEYDLKLILVKPRAHNIKIVNAHYSEINNEISEDCRINAQKIRIFTTEDSKLWFTIDNSFNLREAEAVHPETSKRDIEHVTAWFQDIRDKAPPTPSQMALMLYEISAGLDVLIKLNTPKPLAQSLNVDIPNYIG